MDTTSLAPVQAPPRLWLPFARGFATRLLAHWPALIAAALFLTLIGYEIAVIKSREGGRFVYVIDDTYGHLATARNLAQHGVWTYNYANGFESSISSLAWPVVIAACFLLFGVHEYIPLALNILALTAALFYLGAILRRMTGSGLLTLVALCFTVVFTPFPAVAVTGMEHSLQILLDVAFVDLAARLLMEGGETLTTPRSPRWLCMLGVLAVLTRFEGLFLIAAVGLLLLCRRRWKLAVALGIVSVAPTVLFGLYSLSRGWYFLPNSLMLKGNVGLTLTLPGLVTYFSKGYHLMMSEQHMPALIAAAVVTLLAVLQRRWSLWNYPALVMLITLITAAQHLQFASLGWFYRYEAYLIVLVFFGIGAALGDGRPPQGFRYWLRPAALPHLAALALAVLFLAVPFWPRTGNSFPFIISASYSVYGQQYQMARFVRRFYRNAGVIANDVCAISFMGDGVRLVDFAGLSSVEALRLRFKGGFDQAAMRCLSREHRSDIAILYDDWAEKIFGGPLPEWVKVGTWTIPNNTVCAGDTVAFYATSQDEAPRLIRSLQQFASALPRDVRQEGLYRGADSLNPAGVYYPAGGIKEATHYWVEQSAAFDLYPAAPPAPGGGEAVLSLGVCTVNQNQTFEVTFNGERVFSRALAPEESGRWVSLPIPVKWRPGTNRLQVTSQSVPGRRPGDQRPVRFCVLDPRRQLTDAGGVTAQNGTAQATE